MEKKLADVIGDIIAAKGTGVLSVSVRNNNSLMKFFFRDGAIYHITYSTCKSLECLISLGMLDTDRAFFISGTRVDVAHPVTLSTGDIVDQIRTTNKTVQWGEQARAGKASSASSDGGDMIALSEFLRLEEELLEMLGPVADIVFDRSCESCNIKRDSPPSRKAFYDLVRLIAQQVPEDQRKLLLAKFAF